MKTEVPLSVKQAWVTKLMVVFSHTLTEEQKCDAFSNLQVSEIVLPDDNMLNFWANIPPEKGQIGELLYPFYIWLEQTGRPGDYVLIQGEFGATLLLVQCAKKLGLIPVYSTTRRKAFEEVQDNGEVRLSHCFKHVRYRKYEVK